MVTKGSIEDRIWIASATRTVPFACLSYGWLDMRFGRMDKEGRVIVSQRLFKMYLSFWFYLGIVRPTGQETIAIDEIVCYSQFWRRNMSQHVGPYREAPECLPYKCLLRRQKEWGENMSSRLYCGFCGKEWVRWGKQLHRLRME